MIHHHEFIFPSTRQALVKGMKEHFPEVEAAQLKAALKKGVAAKVLEQNGQRLVLKSSCLICSSGLVN